MGSNGLKASVLNPGMLTTVQDLGRPGYQAFGIPVGGAMDRPAVRIANLLVGNPENAAALEITLLGLSIQFTSRTLVSIGGADLSARIDGGVCPPWRAFFVEAGATLDFAGSGSGCRAYLAVAGGWDVPVVLGGRGTLLRSNLDGLAGRALRAGDVIPIGAPSKLAQAVAASVGGSRTEGIAVPAEHQPRYSSSPTVRVVPAAHAGALPPSVQERFFGAEFRVSPQSDRVGYRLGGPPIEDLPVTEVVSAPVTFGTIQVPPDGQPIVLMADRQTTGGYARLGEVVSSDLPLLAQLRPGDNLRFRPSSIHEAEQLSLAAEQRIQGIRQAVQATVRFG